MPKTLEQLSKEIADHLGIDPLPIKFEAIEPDDSRLSINRIILVNCISENHKKCNKNILKKEKIIHSCKEAFAA